MTPAYDQDQRRAARDETAARIRRILDTGRWPTGLALAPYEAMLLRRNCADLLTEPVR